MNRSGARLTLILLSFAHLMAMADRALFGAIAPLVGARFGLSDTELGVLLGPAVAVTYAVGALLLGPWADRGWARRLVFAGLVGHAIAGVVIASGGSFGGLLVGRVLLGLAQAALIPAAVVLIAGQGGPPSARALSVFTASSALGRGAGLLTAGLLLGVIAWAGLSPAAGGWRVLLVLTVIPALLLGLACRRARPAVAAARSRGARPWRAALPLWPLFLAAIGPILVGQTLAAWLPTVLVRRDGIPAASAAALVGGVLLVAAPLAQLLGGVAVAGVARLARQPLVVNAACLIAASPLLWLATRVAHPVAIGAAVGAVALLVGGAAFVTIDGVQRACAPTRRGAVTGMFLSTVTLVGTGGGPLLAGVMSDAGTGPGALGRALALIGAGSALLSTAAALAGAARGRAA